MHWRRASRTPPARRTARSWRSLVRVRARVGGRAKVRDLLRHGVRGGVSRSAERRLTGSAGQWRAGSSGGRAQVTAKASACPRRGLRVRVAGLRPVEALLGPGSSPVWHTGSSSGSGGSTLADRRSRDARACTGRDAPAACPRAFADRGGPLPSPGASSAGRTTSPRPSAATSMIRQDF
eukprot:scaffold21917_cov53-Phaeocystis_antarctica.AAC.5